MDALRIPEMMRYVNIQCLIELEKYDCTQLLCNDKLVEMLGLPFHQSDRV